jgi:hypothetical protein
MEYERRIGNTSKRIEKNTPGEIPQKVRKELRTKRYEIIPISNESLRSLREKGAKFSTDWYKGWKFEEQVSGSYEVAIKPHHPLLSESNNKNLFTQKKDMEKYNMLISRKFPGMEAIIDEVGVYTQIILYLSEQKGIDLLKDKFARSITQTEGNEVASIGNVPEGLNVVSSSRSRGNPAIYAIPVIRRKVA